MAAPLILRIIGDATSYFKTAESTIATNTKIGQSAIAMGADFEKSASAQVAAGVKVIQSQRAQLAELTAIQAKAIAGSDVRIAADVAVANAQAKLNRSMGLTSVATGRAGSSAREGERDLGKLTRGVLAGSGAFSALGRSLAFASGGFLAFATGAEVISESIGKAEDLARAQASLSEAIKHTGGDLDQLLPHYQDVAKAAAQFGVSEVDATTGLARATVLTGNAAAAQRAYQEALVISKATGKDFNVVLTATSKAQEGVVTSLRRYGVLVASGSSGTEQFTQVMKRFGGQAAANTTASDKLHAALSNAETTIGEQLLPTFEKAADALANWLTKMNETGKLERDVAEGMTLIKTFTTPLIKGMEELAKAVGLVNDAWRKFSDLTKGNGLVASNLQNLVKAVKLGVGSELFPLSPLQGLLGLGGSGNSAPLPYGGPPPFFQNPLGLGPSQGPFGTAQPQPQATGFQLTITEQIAAAQAALTKSTKDDVEVARQIIARIKVILDKGNYTQKGLLAILQAEAAAMGIIQQASDAAQAKAAARAAAAKAAASTFEIPPALQVAQAKLEAYGKDQTAILHKIIAAAQKAIDSGKKNWQGLVAAYQTIASAQAQLASQAQTFTLPLKLQLQLAKSQALNADTTPVLLRMRAALYKALKAAKGNIQKQIDIWNQIAGINSQLQNSVTNAYGAYKKASLKAETANLGLTAAQRRALEERLSQRGPGGTVPSAGVGAAGYIIDPATGRPVKVTGHRYASSKVPAANGAGGTTTLRLENRIFIYMDGKKVTEVVTRRQQAYRNNNPQSRRGPHAATATA